MKCYVRKKDFIIGGFLYLLIWPVIHRFNIKKISKLLLMFLIYGSFLCSGTLRCQKLQTYLRYTLKCTSFLKG